MAWRGAVGGTGAVEVGQDVLAAADQGSGQGLDLLKPFWDGLPQGVDEPLHQVLSQARLLGAVVLVGRLGASEGTSASELPDAGWHLPDEAHLDGGQQ